MHHVKFWAGWSTAEIKIAKKYSNNLRYVDDTTLIAESLEKLKSLLMKVREEWKGWLKTMHSKKGREECHEDQNHCRWWLQPWNEKTLTPWKKSYDKLRQQIKKQRCSFANKGPSSPSYGFSSCHVRMWGLDQKENLVPKNWCFWTVVLEKNLESLGLQGDPTSPC